MDYVPLILQKEQATINFVRKSLADMYQLRIFDGTSRLEQRLVKLQMLAKSMKGEEIASELISVLSATKG